MRRLAVLALAIFAFGCSHSGAPQIASQSQSVVPLILQTGVPPLHWTQILTGQAAGFGNMVLGVGRAPGGNIWFAETISSSSGFIGYIDMNRRVTEWPTAGAAVGAVVAGADGNMWFHELVETYPSVTYLDRVTPAGNITRFPESLGTGDVCNGPDGNLWTAGAMSGQGSGPYYVQKISTSGTQTLYQVPHFYVHCHKGPDGRVWFVTGRNDGVIGAMDPVTTFFTEYGAPAGYGLAVTAGSDGNVWFLDNGINKITPSGSVTHYSLPYPAESLVLGPDNNLWFSGNSTIGAFSPKGLLVSTHNAASGNNFVGIASGSDGNLYLADECYCAWLPPQVDVFIRRALTASPSPVILAPGTQANLVVSESNYINTWTVVSGNQSVATVTATAKWSSFIVSGVSHGSTALTIADKYGNSLVVNVNVN